MKLKLTLAVLALSLITTKAAPFFIYSNFIPTPPAGTPCNTWRNAEALYQRTAAQGWGWKLDPNTITHTAYVGSNYVVEYNGQQGHHGCNISSVNVIGNATEKFRFTVYNPTNNGTADTNMIVTVTLTGFLQ